MPDQVYDIKSRVSLMGDREYKDAIKGINQGLTVLKTDLAASQAAFKGQAESMEQLRDKSTKLNAIYEKQAEKVEHMSAKLEDMKASGKATQSEINRYTIELNKARAAMNTTAAEIRKTDEAMDKLGDAAEDTGEAVKEEGKASEESSKKTNKLGDALKKLAIGAAVGAALKATADAAKAMGKAMADAAAQAFGLAKDASAYADEIIAQSSVTGLAADELQRWGLVSQLVDVDTETMTGSMGKMTQAMGKAAKGSKADAEKFARLGISIKDSNGQLRDSEDVYAEAIGALGRIENETQRDAMAMELFGKSARELNPLIEAGADGLNDARKEADRLGGVLGGPALEALGKFDDSMQKMQYAGKGLKNVIGSMLVPVFGPLVDVATDSFAEISKALASGDLSPKEMQRLVGNVAHSLERGVIQVGQTLETMLPTLLDALGSVAESVAKVLPKLLESIGKRLTRLGDKLKPGLKKLMESIGKALPKVVNALLPGIKALFAAVPRLVQSLGGLAKPAGELLGTLAGALVKALPELWKAIPPMISGLWNGLKAVDWVGLGKDIWALIKEGLSAIGSGLKDLFDKGKEKLGEIKWKDVGAKLIDLIFKGIGAVGSALKRLFVAGKNKIKNIKWGQLGSDIWDFVVGGLGSIADNLKKMFEDAVDFIRQDIDWIQLGKDIWTWITQGIGDLGKEIEEALFGDYEGSDELKMAQLAGASGRNAAGSVLALIHGQSMRATGLGGSASGSGSGRLVSRADLKDAEGAGKKIVSAVMKGIKAGDPRMASTPKDFGASTRSAVRKGLGLENGQAYSDGLRTAGQITSGMIVGMNNGAAAVQNAVKYAMQQAINAARRTLGIRSPSKVMAGIGMYYDEGFANGITGGIGMVEKAAAQVANASAVSAARRMGVVRGASPAAGGGVSGAAGGAVYNINVTYGGSYTRRDARKLGFALRQEIAGEAAAVGVW